MQPGGDDAGLDPALEPARPLWEPLAEILRRRFHRFRCQDVDLVAEARKAEDAGWASSAKIADATKQTLISNGMKVSPPGAKLNDDLLGLGRQMIDEWLATAGPEGKTLVDAYRR